MATSDGGLRWQALGPLPGGACSVDFVTALDGWCVSAKAASGSESVTIYQSSDGGHHWKYLSNDPPPDNTVTAPGKLPFGCDKTLSFERPALGWAAFSCAGGMPPLYRSTDGGRTWQPTSLTTPPDDLSGGSEFSTPPQLDGRSGAVGFATDSPARTLIYRTSDGGATWSIVTPPGSTSGWLTFILSPTVWRLIDRDSLEGTNNAGRTWFHTTMNHSFNPMNLGGLPQTSTFATTETALINATNGVWHTSDGGQQWTQLAIPGT
jgi:photosystem II stability/assembly factor-like uncharacterized protein